MAKMLKNRTVYYGPSSSGYPTVGSVSANESVEFFWVEGSWCYIRYAVSGKNSKKCGYVKDNAVNHSGENPLVENSGTGGLRYIRDGGTTYTGPGDSGYPSAGSVDAGEAVTYTGYKYNGYALIEYSVSGSSSKKRAWYLADDMTTTPSAASTTIKDPIDPSKNYTNEDHEDYAVNRGTAVYAMCDGVFTAKYCVGSMTSPTGTDAYVSLGICGNLVPAAQRETADHRKPQKIQYGHLDSLMGYNRDPQYTEAIYGSTENACANIEKHAIGERNVKCGEFLGYSGNTGNSTGPHLHIKLVY